MTETCTNDHLDGHAHLLGGLVCQHDEATHAELLQRQKVIRRWCPLLLALKMCLPVLDPVGVEDAQAHDDARVPVLN